MTTTGQLLDEIERGILSNYSRPQYDIPGATATSTATTIQMTSTTMMSPGALLEINYELMYVRSFTNPNATVIRGFEGTTARSVATTDLIRINPQVSRIAMWDAFVAEVRSWDQRLFAVEQEEVSFTSWDPAAEAFPSAKPYRVLFARPQTASATDAHGWIMPELRQDEGIQFASGYSLHLPPGQVWGTAVTMDVAYAIPFDLSGIELHGPYTFSTNTDLEDDLGMTPGMLEIIRYGVLYRVMAGRQPSRLDAYVSGRADIEQGMPALSPLQASAQFKKMHDDAYDTEVRRLMNRFPIRTAG